MEYQHYNEEDFIRDDYFLQWVREPDGDSNSFWLEFQEKYPEQRAVMDRARELVLLLTTRKNEPKVRMAKGRIWDTIQEQTVGTEVQQGMRRLKKDTGFRPLYMVSGLIVVMGLAILGMYTFGVFTDHKVAGPPQITLLLQDGSQQVIDEGDTRTITTKEGLTLGNQDKHILKYSNTQQDATKELAYNELKVPYGKNFELVLADGSHIYLNAGSTLRYPVQFLPDQPRDVYLDGEAFFEVTKDDNRPFTVRTEQMNTQVYGTRFNVTSYKNEGNTYTVLEEGSVGVYPPETDESAPVKIMPGQRAVMENGSIAVEEVRVEKYLAWTRGELYFRNDPFALILKKLERHFNVSIASNYAELDQMEFIGTFKGQSLEEILRAFQEYTPFHYTREGNNITITPPH
ncbi:FecR family protein [Sinomicrobium oceani]|uniref:FecR family protein n=1 Tax=Sinomicrobium oceani TaxID=1150368 RepID=UPI00227ABDE0|nr:FecR domain-containing protein [Sinomicrobium oceani]